MEASSNTYLPQIDDVLELEFSLESDQDPPKAEEEIERTCAFKMIVQLGVHYSYQLLKG
jgi:hypothetical protein